MISFSNKPPYCPEEWYIELEPPSECGVIDVQMVENGRAIEIPYREVLDSKPDKFSVMLNIERSPSFFSDHDSERYEKVQQLLASKIAHMLEYDLKETRLAFDCSLNGSGVKRKEFKLSLKEGGSEEGQKKYLAFVCEGKS